MVTTPPTRKEDVRDGFAKNGWPRNKGRDGERTSMQWTPGAQAGFSTNPDTWLPIPLSYVKTNVQIEEADPDSLLHWYQSLIALRRSNVQIWIWADRPRPVDRHRTKSGSYGAALR